MVENDFGLHFVGGLDDSSPVGGSSCKDGFILDCVSCFAGLCGVASNESLLSPAAV